MRKGTFMLTTTMKAFHGRHILTRQISNSKGLQERMKFSQENDFDESDEERDAFNNEIQAFNAAMNDELNQD